MYFCIKLVLYAQVCNNILIAYSCKHIVYFCIRKLDAQVCKSCIYFSCQCPMDFLFIITNRIYCVGLLRGRKIPFGQMQENMDACKLLEVEDREAN